jgi:hypothetical protein
MEKARRINRTLAVHDRDEHSRELLARRPQLASFFLRKLTCMHASKLPDRSDVKPEGVLGKQVSLPAIRLQAC